MFAPWRSQKSVPKHKDPITGNSFIRIALENRCVVDSRVCSVTFKTLTSFIFQTEYSIALLLYILSSTRSNSIAKERKIRLKNFEGRPFHFQIFDHLV